jgi:hypothetical protein
MRAATSLLVVLASAAGCDRPKTVLVCHNANCAEPTDPARDDTIPAMRESLELEFAGLPVIDGMEIDTFWRGSDDTCIFAHDLDNTDNVPADEPAKVLAEYFARTGPITFADVPFEVSIELKPDVDAAGTAHSAAQAAMHAQCAWQLYAILDDAAAMNARTINVTFGSFAPDLLRATIDATPATTRSPHRYGTYEGIPPPLDPDTRPLGDYAGLPIEVVEFHTEWILDAQYEAVRSAHEDVAFFMFSLTDESFYTIEQYEPVYVTTSEARLFRRWLQR